MIPDTFFHPSPLMTMWMSLTAASAVLAGWFTAFALTDAHVRLAADASLAAKRSGNSQDFLSRCIEVPAPKLSDQLLGKAPFTFLHRLLANQDIADSGFEAEFLIIRAKRLGLTVVRADVGDLLARLDEVLPAKKPMAKVGLAEPQEKAS